MYDYMGMLSFFKRPEEEVFRLTIRHAELCKLCVVKLVEAVDRSAKGEEYLDQIKAIFQAEEEADGIRRMVGEKLAKGTIPPLSREDFVRLIERMDMIADWAKDAARLLRIVRLNAAAKDVMEKIRGQVQQAFNCVSAILEAVELMYRDFNKCINILHRVEEIEERADDEYVEALEALYVSSSISPVETFILSRLVETIENLTDSCEDVSDTIKVIIIRGRR